MVRTSSRERSLVQSLPLSGIGWTVFAGVMAAFVLSPALAMLVPAFSDGAKAYRNLQVMPRIGSIVRNTFVLGVGSASVALILGTMLAITVYRTPGKVRGLLSVIPLLPLVVPSAAFIIGWVFLLAPTAGYINQGLRLLPPFSDLTTGPLNIYSMPGIIVMTGLILTSFVFVFVYAGLTRIGPDYDDAAEVSGAAGWTRLRTITIPLLRPSLVHAGAIVFLLAAGQFTAPLLLGRTQGIDTVTTAMFSLLEVFPVDYGRAAALGSIIVLLGVIVIFVQRMSLRHGTRYTVHSGRTGQMSGRRASAWTVVPVTLYGVLTAGLPLLALFHVSISPFWSGKLSLSNATLANYGAVLGDPRTVDAFRNTAITSVITIALLVPIGFIIALSQLQYVKAPRPVKWLHDVLSTVPVAVPNVLLAFGILLVYTSGPIKLYGTLTVIIIAYAIDMLPYSSRSQSGVLLAYGRDYYDAARVSGASFGRALGNIMFPLARPGIAGGAAIMLVLLFHEFTVSLMVRSVRTNLVGARLYDIWSGGTYPQVAVMALTMVFVTAVGVSFAMYVAGRDVLTNV